MYRGYPVIDGHADILYRMEKENIRFYDAESPLHQNYHHLHASGVDLQVFVTFVDPHGSLGDQLLRVLRSLHRYKAEVARPGVVTTIYSKEDLEAAPWTNGSKAALLSVEGADSLQGEISVLHTWFALGVRLVGLTWNGGNCVADGVGEPRGAGLTAFGRTVVATMNDLGMLIDVSHLAPQGVDDVLAQSRQPIVASHSNACAVYDHRRNLRDEQIRAIASRGGMVGATFVPAFIGAGNHISSSDLLRHIDHLLTIAGPDAVGLGSDFDGIATTPVDLRNGSDYPAFLEALWVRYGEAVCGKLFGGNWLRVLGAVLPDAPRGLNT